MVVPFVTACQHIYSHDTLTQIVRNNKVEKRPMIVEDIIVDEKIFGPELHSLKGKPVRKSLSQEPSDYISVPEALKNLHQEVEISVDVMFINKFRF